ncbi:MAG: DUF4124 domain-containing protein [Pseudoxanthomonas sp.]
MRVLPCPPALLLTGSLLLTSMAAALPAHAQSTRVYQWKDASGVTHYSDSPPPVQTKAQNRQIGNRDPDVPAAAEEKPESQQCLSARSNLQVLAGSAPVQQDTDGDGKPDTMLDDTARSNQKALAEAAVKAYCRPAAE